MGQKVEIRPNKGAHVIFDRRIVNVGIITRAIDGRMIYLFPHENTTLLGTTAMDTWEDPDTLVATHDERIAEVAEKIYTIQDGKLQLQD